LAFGDKRQIQPPRIDEDLSRLMGLGAEVYLVADDAEARGIASGELLSGVRPIGRAGVAGLYGRFDQVWHW
jgi:hypothetical protein